MAVPIPPLTLGVEEEYQIIDPETRNLHSYISEFLSQDKRRARKLNLKPEFMQSQVEVGSHVCRNIKEVRQEVIRLRRAVCDMAEENGLKIAAASTHPFADWHEQSITEGVRYRGKTLAPVHAIVDQHHLDAFIYGHWGPGSRDEA